MLRQEDRDAIEDLFERLRNVERNSGPRDVDAEQLIRRHLERHPAVAYYMAQTIIVQEAALREQQQKLAELEEAAKGRSGGFLDSIFGDDRPQQSRRTRGPWEQGDAGVRNRGGDGGGFLAGAAQTALGVTGGLLLGSAIAGMFGGGEAHAAEPAQADDPVYQDIDADGDDWGGFDIGGEF